MDTLEESKRLVKLRIYDRDVPVNILKEEEYYYREAAKLITETINNYASFFQHKKSKEDLLYMALLDIALRYEKDLEHSDKNSLEQMLGKLTSQIEDALKEK